MVSQVDIYNRALTIPGTRTSVTAAEIAANSSNEAIQLNLVYDNIRRRLLRMAPWDCGLKTANLVYITSSPGTPENQSAPTTLWQRGQPTPPWAYEYQYPIDCLRACWLIPATQTGFAGGIPITTAVTGGAASFWQGPPVKFKVQTDIFFSILSAAVVSGGTGYAVGDVITLATPANTSAPIGAPAQLTVTGVSAGAVTSVAIVPSVMLEVGGVDTNAAGAYFTIQAGAQAQGSTTGTGSGATFTPTWSASGPQRTILTNQEFATMVYVADNTNPNIWDDAFIEALWTLLGAAVTIPLTGDKKLANGAIQEVNAMIALARSMDGNEGLTINDVTPDFIRIRGVDFAEPYSGPYSGFDWGGMWPTFG